MHRLGFLLAPFVIAQIYGDNFSVDRTGTVSGATVNISGSNTCGLTCPNTNTITGSPLNINTTGTGSTSIGAQANNTQVQLAGGNTAFLVNGTNGKVNLWNTQSNGTRVGIGNALFTAAYPLDVQSSDTGNSAAHFSSTNDARGILIGGRSNGNFTYVASDADWNGSAFVARGTAAHTMLFNSDGTFSFEVNTGLTSGNTFTLRDGFGSDMSGNFFNNQPTTPAFACGAAAACTFQAASGQTTQLGRTGDPATLSGDVTAASSKNRGSITMSTGSGTATVLSGAICLCEDSTSVLACKATVSGTTLTVTVTGGGSDVAKYICL